jgi:NAD(P)H dehydrogenase (quinone)
MTDFVDRPARVLVVYYSATGHVRALAEAVAHGAENAGARVRLRHVEELAPDMLISQNQAWGRHRAVVNDQPTATLDDLDWADGIAFGTPTRFGNVAAQLKLFLDQAGELWEEGKLINKVVTSFTSAQTDHGGQESTILALNNTFYHWGAIVLPLGYTVTEAFNGGGNPYGASYTSGTRIGQLAPHTVASAVAQGRRLARVARIIGSAQELGLLDVRRRRQAARPAHIRDGAGSAQAPERRHVQESAADPLALAPYSPIGQTHTTAGSGTSWGGCSPELRKGDAK